MRGTAASRPFTGAPKLTPALAPQRSWGPFCISGGAAVPCLVQRKQLAPGVARASARHASWLSVQRDDVDAFRRKRGP